MLKTGFFIERFKDLTWQQPRINIKREGNYAVFTSDVFAWGVKIKAAKQELITDNYFDIIPGIPYYIKWPESEELPETETIANEFLK